MELMMLLEEETPVQKCCCLKCKFYEARSQFCRKGPPTPIAVPDKYGSHIMSAFPKISCPALDFCGQFESAFV